MALDKRVTDAEQFAIQILTAFGLSASKIEESDLEKRADILANDEHASYVIEVKQKFDRDGAFEVLHLTTEKGKVFSWATPTTQSNSVDGILKDARKQLDATPESTNAFRLIWFHADGMDHDARWKQAYATFYGAVHLWPLSGTDDNVAECFYFDSPASHAMPSVDAMVLSDSNQAQLCLNEFSPQTNAFRQCLLYARFAEKKAVVDPSAMVEAGSIIACRFDGSRKDDAKVLQALKEQTDRRYQVIRLTQHSAAVRVRPTSKGG